MHIPVLCICTKQEQSNNRKPKSIIRDSHQEQRIRLLSLTVTIADTFCPSDFLIGHLTYIMERKGKEMGNGTISRTTFAKGMTAGVVVAVSLGILAVGDYSTSDRTDADTTEESQALPSGSYTPGDYTATAKGIESDVTVTATFDETKMTAITADVSGETAGIGADIGDEMIQKALDAQSADIDGVASATITSDAFKAALADCIAQASGTAAVETGSESEAAAETETQSETAKEAESDAATESESEAAAETEAQSETAAETESEAAVGTEAQSETAAETESEAATESESEAAIETPSDSSFISGTYTASAKGMESDVVVSVTFDKNRIVSIGLCLAGETPEIGAEIGTEMAGRILRAQSADVDAVSGATVTSNAVLAALEDCLMQAKGQTAGAEESFTAETPEDGTYVTESEETES